MTLSLEEEAPFVMADLPGFSSAEDNVLSIMGRALNPECQKMSGLILTMPRKWQKEGRVRDWPDSTREALTALGDLVWEDESGLLLILQNQLLKTL
ncbi:hypothetical protein Bca4012_088617 [Brassica carinata]